MSYLQQPKPRQKHPLGTTFFKYFEGYGIFEGIVVKYEPLRGYLVEYSDGDSEHLQENDIDRLLAINLGQASSANANNPHQARATSVNAQKPQPARPRAKSRKKDVIELLDSSDSSANEEKPKARPRGDLKTTEDVIELLDSSTGSEDEEDNNNDDDEMQIANPIVGMVSSPHRRSGRNRNSTITYIDGQPVLKANNYRVRGGQYLFEEEGESAPIKRKDAAMYGDNVKKLKTNHHQPRKLAPHEIRLKQHNAKIQASKLAKQPLRQAFLKDTIELLKPWMEESVYKTIRDTPVEVAPSETANLKQQESIPQPSLVTGGTMRDYQLQGLSFMVMQYKRNLGTIIGDEMGLGKSLQSISMLCYLKESEGKTGPSLIVCPLSVMSSWTKELAHWAPALKVYRLHSSGAKEQQRQRKELLEHMLGTGDDETPYDVILTSYEMLKVKCFSSTWARVHFNYLILDEGHKVKGHETEIAAAVRRVHSENQLLLTGTPLQNNLVELWSLLNIMYKDVFTTLEPFKKAFDLNENRVDKTMLMHAQEVLQLIMLRRLKDRVEKLLPPKLETRVYCPLSKTQIFWYRALLDKDMDAMSRVEQGATSKSSRNLLENLFMQLRKCSNHPYLFDGAEPKEGATLTELVGASGKLSVLDQLLRTLCQKGHRVVLFSQFTMVLNIIQDYAEERGWNYARLDGGTSRAKRDYLVNQFNAPNSPFFLFIMSTKAGGQGLNLQTADTCILYDSDWNPANDLQAMARTHRIGQRKIVHVYRLISAGTIEERIVERAQKKLLLDQSVNRGNSGDEDEGIRGLGIRDLLADIKFGAQAVFGGMANKQLPTEAEIDIITDRNRKHSDTVGKLQGNAESNALDFDASADYTSSQCFQGLDFKRLRQEREKEKKNAMPKTMKDIIRLYNEVKAIEGTKRQRKSRIVMLASNGSGYGSAVPVLAANNYDLEGGEVSVYQRELSNRKGNLTAPSPKEKKIKEHSDWCMLCLDTEGGYKVGCQHCPSSYHPRCIDLPKGATTCICSHHKCTSCGKATSAAGGLLFPCALCPNSFCEACLPSDTPGFRYLGKNQRWADLGYEPNFFVYIHCSAECEEYAKRQFGWKPQSLVQALPGKLDVSMHFGDKDEDELKLPAQDVTIRSPQHFPKTNTPPKARRQSQGKIQTHSQPTQLVDLTSPLTKPAARSVMKSVDHNSPADVKGF